MKQGKNKMVRVSTKAHGGLVKLSSKLGEVPLGLVVEWLVNYGLMQADDPQPGNPIGNLVRLNQEANNG